MAKKETTKKAIRGNKEKPLKVTKEVIGEPIVDDFNFDDIEPEVEEQPKQPKTKKVKEEKKKKEKKVKEEGVFELDSIKAELKAFELEIFDNGDNGDDEDIPYFIPFANEALQFITGGACGGKFMEISGDSQTGKSYILYQMIAEVQKLGGNALLIDGERASTKEILRKCGVKLDGSFGRSTERDMTAVFGLMLAYVKGIRKKEKELKIKPKPILLGQDSFPSLQTASSMEAYEAGKEAKGYAAMQKNAKFSQLMEKFIGDLADYEATFVMINQTQTDHSIMFGSKIKSKGEDVIKFWATQRLRGKSLKKLTQLVDSTEKKEGVKIQTGIKVEWTAIKNRFVAPFQRAITYTQYSSGMHPTKGFIENLVTTGRAKITMVAKKKADGTDSKNKIEKYLHVKSGEVFDTVEEMLEQYPELKIPVKVGEFDSDDFSEDDFESESKDKED